MRYRVRSRFWWLLLALVAALAVWQATRRPPALPSAQPVRQAAPKWVWQSSGLRIPRPLAGTAAAANPTGIYVVGGLNTSSVSSVYRITPNGITDWRQLPVALHDATAAIVGSAGYVLGGGTAVSFDTIERFPLPPEAGPVTQLPSLPTPLSDLGSAVFRQRIYLVGGHGDGAPSAVVWQYRPGYTAVPFARLPAGVRYAAVAVNGRTLWVVGGLTASGATNRAWTVNLVTGQISAVVPFPYPVTHAEAAFFDGRLTVAGGYGPDGPTAKTWMWNAGKDRWQAGPPLPQPLADGSLVPYANRLWWIGGVSSSGRAVSAIYRLTPVG